jgi:hypothetical protein
MEAAYLPKASSSWRSVASRACRSDPRLCRAAAVIDLLPQPLHFRGLRLPVGLFRRELLLHRGDATLRCFALRTLDRSLALTHGLRQTGSIELDARQRFAGLRVAREIEGTPPDHFRAIRKIVRSLALAHVTGDPLRAVDVLICDLDVVVRDRIQRPRHPGLIDRELRRSDALLRRGPAPNLDRRLLLGKKRHIRRSTKAHDVALQTVDRRVRAEPARLRCRRLRRRRRLDRAHLRLPANRLLR